MIAHGTGVVPFISICERLKHLAESHPRTETMGAIYLFLGIRNEESDFIHKEQLKSIFTFLNEKGIKAHLYVACSRSLTGESDESWLTLRKGYVQEYLSDASIQQLVQTSI